MKNILLALILFLPGYLLYASDKNEHTPPADSEIVHAIFINHDIPLASIESCASAPIDPGASTIGEYVSQLIAATQKKEFEGLKVRISKELVKGESGESFWECSLFFYIEDDYSPWEYGVSFLMRISDHSVIRSSFECPGVP
ncbi:MAG: hypothetical protein JSV25_13135 [Spirochaetota bacterium]|nr:MAG: hypothetical protein JSV25_13135 [Spirochaetota bacterium]